MFLYREAAFTFENIPGTPIYAEKSVSETDRDSAVDAWNMLPENIRNGISDMACNIYLSPEKEDEHAGGIAHFGDDVTDKDHNYMMRATVRYISALAEGEGLSGTVLHECGHQLDMSLAKNIKYFGHEPISDSAEWEKVFCENKKALSKYDKTAEINVRINPHEAFAESFRVYYLAKDWMISNAPDVYLYMDRTIKDYEREAAKKERIAPAQYKSETKWDVSPEELKGVDMIYGLLERVEKQNMSAYRIDKETDLICPEAEKHFAKELSSSREAQEFTYDALMYIFNKNERSDFELEDLRMRVRQMHRPQRDMTPSEKRKNSFHESKRNFAGLFRGVNLTDDVKATGNIASAAKEYTENAIRNKCAVFTDPLSLSSKTALVIGKEGFLYDENLNPLVVRFNNGTICASMSELSHVYCEGLFVHALKKEIEKNINESMPGKNGIIISGKREIIESLQNGYEMERNRDFVRLSAAQISPGSRKVLEIDEAFDKYAPFMYQLYDAACEAADENAVAEYGIGQIENNFERILIEDGYTEVSDEVAQYVFNAEKIERMAEQDESFLEINSVVYLMKDDVRRFRPEAEMLHMERNSEKMWPTRDEEENDTSVDRDEAAVFDEER